MPSYVDATNGVGADASFIQQVIDNLKGTAGKGVPTSLTAVNDAINFALAVKNNESGASKAFIVYKADGTVLFQVDKNGVVASPDGTTGASQIPTLTGTQTFTNKTLTSPTIAGPTITAPVINGAVTGTTFGAWTAFTPGLSQNGVLATSVATGRYQQVGKTVFGSVAITANATGTAGNNISVTGLPVASLTTGAAVWGTYQRAAGAGLYTLAGAWGSTTSVVFANNAGTSNYLGSTPSFAVAVGDVIVLSFMYEAA